MSSYILKHNWKKYFAIDNYFWPHQYWYIEKKDSDTWLSLDCDKSKILKSLPICKDIWVKITKKQYFKQLKENIKLLEEENSNISKAYLKLEIKYNDLKKDNKLLNDFNNAWMWEIRFSNLQKEHYKQLLDEVEVLVEKWIKKHIIKQVIDNWKKRADIDISIHCDEIFK